MRILILAAAAALLGSTPALAQIDYRNLDDDRPTLVEDAYPVEQWAFEWLAPWRYEREAGGHTLHLFVPELAYGILPNAQLGVKLPFAGVDEGAGARWQWTPTEIGKSVV